MRKIILSTLIPLSTITGVVAIPVATTSCADIPLPDNIDAQDSIFTYEHTFTVNFTSKDSFPSNAKIEIVNKQETLNDLSLDSWFFKGNEGYAIIKINPDIHFDKKINYSLRFSLNEKTIDVGDLSVYYIYEEEEQDDRVQVINKTIEHVGTADFDRKYNYKFQFSAMPKSSVTIKATGLDSHLTLDSTEIAVEKTEDGLFFLTIPVTLKETVLDDWFTTFNFELTFMNSYGREQRFDFDLGCSFIKGSDSIPEVYYRIDNNNCLCGFTEAITTQPKLLLNFTKITIPDNVETINADVFNWSANGINPFENISEIEFGENTEFVKERAFNACKNIRLLDLSKWKKTGELNLPAWLYYAGSYGKCFDSNNLSYFGSIIIPNSSTNRNDWASSLQIRGLYNAYGRSTASKNISWSPYLKKEVSNDEWFNIEQRNNQNVLTGFKNGVIDTDLKNCGLIKIPDNVDSIEITDTANGFQRLGKVPADLPEELKQGSQRVLLLNNRLSSMKGPGEEGLFSNSSLCGYISIPNNIKSIPDKCFYAADKNSTGDAGIVSFNICFGKKSMIEQIGNEAFAESLMDYFRVPINLDRTHCKHALGAKLFYNSTIYEIDFSDYDPNSSRPIDDPFDFYADIDAGQYTLEGLRPSEDKKERHFIGRQNWIALWGISVWIAGSRYLIGGEDDSKNWTFIYLAI